MTSRTTRRVIRPRWERADSTTSLPATSVEASALEAEAIAPSTEVEDVTTIDFTTLLEPDAAPVYGPIEGTDFLVLLASTDERPRVPRPPSAVDAIRVMVRRAISARAFGYGISIIRMESSRAEFEFKLVRGQWTTARTYALATGDVEEVERVVAAALADLDADIAKYPAT